MAENRELKHKFDEDIENWNEDQIINRTKIKVRVGNLIFTIRGREQFNKLCNFITEMNNEIVEFSTKEENDG